MSPILSETSMDTTDYKGVHLAAKDYEFMLKLEFRLEMPVPFLERGTER